MDNKPLPKKGKGRGMAGGGAQSPGSCRAKAILQLGEVAEIKAQMFSLHKSSIEELNLNLAMNPPFYQTAVIGCCCFVYRHFDVRLIPKTSPTIIPAVKVKTKFKIVGVG
ncbi:MAG: hypothetical protein IPP11_11730 [Chitinophagaceae bacterium]|nr:hypothetical protein [Chitinophagaceae bacterium]